jgi:hypothetical protein
MLSTLTSRVVAVSAVSALAALGLVTSASVALADPPTFHGVPGPITVTAGAADTAAVTYGPITVTDDDNDDAFTCTAANGATSTNGFTSGGTFSLGVTTVTCVAPDEPENPPENVIKTFTVTVHDQAVVFSGVPAPITVDATSPAGATVTYTPPTASEPGETEAVAVTCAPPSGSTFAIGSTKVTCTATDPDNTSSPVSASFTVTVVGAAGQLVDLFQDVQGLGPGLANTVLIAQRAVAAGNTPRACLALNAFIIEVATHIPPLSPAITGDLYADAAQIQAVLGC